MSDNSRLSEFASKMAAYWCIVSGLAAAITYWAPGNGPLTIALNLAGIALTIAGVLWLIRLRRRFG